MDQRHFWIIKIVSSSKVKLSQPLAEVCGSCPWMQSSGGDSPTSEAGDYGEFTCIRLGITVAIYIFIIYILLLFIIIIVIYYLLLLFIIIIVIYYYYLLLFIIIVIYYYYKHIYYIYYPLATDPKALCPSG